MAEKLDILEWLKNNEAWVLYEISISPADEHDWLYRELQLIRDIKASIQSDWETKYCELVEMTASRIAESEKECAVIVGGHKLEDGETIAGVLAGKQ